MPIKFHCPSCHQMLGIARRKAGSVVSCPRCSYPATVPSDEPEPSRSMPMRGDRPAFERRDFERWIGFDEDQTGGSARGGASTALAEPPTHRADSPAPAAPSVHAPAPPVALTSSSTVAQPIAPRLRSANYEPAGVDVRLVGALLVGFSLMAFGGGYFVGRNSSFQRPSASTSAPATKKWAPDKSAPPEQAAAGQFSISGRVQYRVGNDLFADSGSRVLAFPTNSRPTRKLNYQGLRPGDDGALDQSGAEGLKRIGGVVATVDENGSYSLPLSKPGAYWVVALSKHAARPGEISLLPEELKLNDFFADLTSLIGKREFSVVIRMVGDGTGKSDAPKPHANYSPEFKAAAPAK